MTPTALRALIRAFGCDEIFFYHNLGSGIVTILYRDQLITLSSTYIQVKKWDLQQWVEELEHITGNPLSKYWTGDTDE